METNNHKYKGYHIQIVQDEHAESPDSWGNEDAFIVYDHRQFSVERKGFEPLDIFNTINEAKAKKEPTYEGYHVFVLNAYIHSGVSLSLGRQYPFNDRWDVSTTGYVLVKKQKGWSWARAKAEKIAESIVSEWNDYLHGNVYGFTIQDSQENDLDSCWGFYGDPDGYVLEEAKASVDCEIRRRVKARVKRLKDLIINKVPIIHRQLPSLF